MTKTFRIFSFLLIIKIITVLKFVDVQGFWNNPVSGVSEIYIIQVTKP